MKRRLLAMVLSLAMLMGLLPTAALAAGSGGPSGGAPYQDLGQSEEGAVSAAKFTIYKDSVKVGSPKENVLAGQLSETAPDLTGENLYFDHAEVNGRRVYEAGTLTEQDITYYGSISGALSILGESETIDLYYVSKYPVTYNVTGAEKTAGDDLVKKGDSLSFRVKPSEKGKRLVVSVNSKDITGTGTVFDDTTGEMLFTVENVQERQAVVVQEVNAATYTLTYNQESGAFRNGSITGPSSGQSIKPGGTITIQMQSNGTLFDRYVLNMLVINGREVTTLPSNAGEGAYVESTLPSGETVRVTLTHEDYTDPLPPYDYTNHYTVMISDVYTDLYISEANFKLDDRNEVIIKELTGIGDIVGWDGGAEEYATGSINHVYLQTTRSGNEFYFNLRPGYEKPQLTVKVNGQASSEDMHFEENIGNLYDGRDPSYTQEQYQYRFDLPNGLGDNIELFLTATPITYSVEYRNDKNNDDLIGDQEAGFTVVEGNKDTITITSRTPYEVVGFVPDGYKIKNDTSNKVYRAGETVKVSEIAGLAQSNTIVFVPNWLAVEEAEERQITIHLYIEDPTNGTQIEADSYPRTVGSGNALFRPNEERGREIIGDYISGSDHSWKNTYNQSDFILREGGEIQVVPSETNSLDFHFDVKKGKVTVNFAWGQGENAEGNLPSPVTDEFAIRQPYSVDVSSSIPKGYTASETIVKGTVPDAGDVTKTVYLYKDANGDQKPDNHTITLTFVAGENGTINTEDSELVPGGDASEDQKKLTYTLTKPIEGQLKGDVYPGYVPRVTVTEDGLQWRGWFKQGGTSENQDRYSSYAGKGVPADAEDITFEAEYVTDEGYKTVTVNYYKEKDGEPGEFVPHDQFVRAGKIGNTVPYPRSHMDGYVTPHEGEPGSITVTENGENTVNVYYYQDKDNNGKPDTYTVTLTFRGTGYGSWDTEDDFWTQMEAGKDYIYDTDSRALKVFLVKANEAGFEAETYPAAPKVNPEDGWLFDSWQDSNKHAYGSGTEGDGITVGSSVGAEDANKSYTSVYNEDKNNDEKPDDEQYVTITFQAGEHGTFADSEKTVTYDKLLPGYSSYPEAPAVTASTGWQFAGWSPEYDKSGTIEATVQESQMYTVTYRGQGTLTYGGNAQSGGEVFDLPDEQTVWEGTTVELSGQTPTHTPVNETSVVFIGWSRTKTGQIYGEEDQEAFEKIALLPGRVYIDSTALTIYAVWGYDTDGNQKPDVTEPTEKPNLINVVPPAAITVENGTAIEEMGLPTQVTIQTTKGDMQANVTWDTQNTSYDPSKAEAQTFTLNGTLTLPEGVTNTNSIPLMTTISITVNAKDVEPGPDPSESYTLTYDANGGFGGPGQEKVSADEAENYQLNTTDKPTHKTAEDGTMIIFIGWSAEQDTKIYGASDKDGPNTIDKLTLTANDEVYAVWGYDANENGTPDVEEDGKYTLAYDGNAINDGDQVAGVPDGGEIKYVSGQVAVLDTEEPTYTLAPATDDSAVIPGPTDEPETETLPSGESAGEEEPTESEPAATDPVEESIPTEESDPPVETTPAHVPELASIGMTRLSYRSAGDGSGDSVVFIGWSLNQHRQIFKGTDTEAFKNVQIVPAVTFDDEDITVYAVWGYDSDNDGTADVLGEDYVIRSYAGPNGSIDPNGDTTVAEGGDQGFTFIPDSGYAVDKIVIDGDTYLNDGNLNLAGYDADGKTYTFTNVQADRSIVVTFSADADGDGVPDKYDPAPSERYTVTARVNDGNGTITPVSKTVDAGDDVVFTITAYGGYALDYITVDGKVVYSNNDAENPFKDTWTLKNVQANSEVVAYFGEDQNGDNVPDAPTYLTVTARAGENGAISPSGTLLVKRGESQSFSITASSDYHISDVAVNGVSVGAVSSYEMISISENMTITASFARDSSGGGSHTTRYTITASAGKGGEISPDGSVRVVRGSSKTFTITPDAGYVIEDVLVDGESVGAVDKYTFENVREKHTIKAVFAEQNGGVADPDDTGVSGWLNTKDHSAYLGGYGGGWFGPDDNMTRAQVAQMFYNLLLNKNVPITVSFSDVAPDAWYAEAVNTLGSLGIVAGIGNGQFAPDRAITRAEFTVIAMRFAELDTSGENIFTDVSENDWFYDYVVGAIKYGWITGYSDGRFGPYDTITRAQVTTIVNRMLDRSADEAYVDRHADELEQFTDVPDTHWAYYEVAEATNAHDYDRTSGSEDWTQLW